MIEQQQAITAPPIDSNRFKPAESCDAVINMDDIITLLKLCVAGQRQPFLKLATAKPRLVAIKRFVLGEQGKCRGRQNKSGMQRRIDELDSPMQVFE